MNDKKPTVNLIAFPPDQSAFFEVVDYQRDIAAASEDFLPDFPLGQGAQMIQRIKPGKLAEGQARCSQVPVGSPGYRFGRPHQLYVSVQGSQFLFAAPVFMMHIFLNIK